MCNYLNFMQTISEMPLILTLRLLILFFFCEHTRNIRSLWILNDYRSEGETVLWTRALKVCRLWMSGKTATGREFQFREVIGTHILVNFSALFQFNRERMLEIPKSGAMHKAGFSVNNRLDLNKKPFFLAVDFAS